MMTRLIDADALKKAACVKFYTTPYYKHILDLIDNAPTARCSDSCDIETQLLGAELHGIKSGYEEAQKKFMRPQGKWIVTAEDNDGVHRICCPLCSYEKGSNSIDPIVVTFTKFPKFCENCGAKMDGKEADNETN